MAALLLLVGCSDDAPDEGQGGNGGVGGAGGTGGKPAPGTYQDSFVQLARMQGSTFVEILEVRARDADTVLFCSGVQGLVVVDVTDPAQPQRRHSLASSLGSQQYPRCQHTTFSGDIVYASNRGDEIQPTPFITAFDIGGATPVEGASYTDANASFEGLAAAGDYLYAAVHADGVLILENTGSALELRGTVAGLTNAWGLAVAGDRLYVADGDAGLAVVDVSDPTSPVMMATVAIGGAALSVELDPATSMAYVAASSGGLVIIDVSDSSAPTQVGRIDTPGTALQVALAGGYAYLADWNDVRVFDVSDPANVVLVATERIDVQSFPRVLGLAAIDNHAFLGEWTGLYAYELRPEHSAPDIRITNDSIDLGPVAAGQQAAAAVVFQNEGQQPLIVTELIVEGEGYTSLSSVPIELAPGESTAVEVGFTASADVERFGTLTIASDDPDEPWRVAEIVANRYGKGVGDPAPTVQVSLLSGGNWDLSSQLGNVVLLSYFATF